jgi:nucleotide-binding universal stress UspA family protein
MMFKHILIATDGSTCAETAARHGFALARQLNGEVTAVTVTEPWMEPIGQMTPPSWAEVYRQAAAENAGSTLASLKAMAQGKGIPCTAIHVSDQHPAEGIVETAKARACDVIVIGSHGRRGVARLLLGSVAAKVVALSDVPVLVCR